MREYLYSLLLGPNGDILWKGDYKDRHHAVAATNNFKGIVILQQLCKFQQTDFAIDPVNILSQAEKLGLVSREGCAPGFLNILPPGVLIEKCLQSFNRTHLAALKAFELDLPIIFDYNPSDIKDLTEQYEKKEKMFKVEDAKNEYRLSYAADPGLFSYLRGKVLDSKELPLTIYSPTEALRRFTRHLSRFDHTRQYHLPDIHIFATSDEAPASYLKNVNLGAEGARFWVGEEWVQFIDIVEDFFDKRKDICANIAIAANQFTLVNVLKKQPLYYAMRSGIMLDGGNNPIMFYNSQWDNENPARFNIVADNQKKLVVIHANLAAGSGLMSVIIGRAVMSHAAKIFPVEISLVQVALIPVSSEHQEFAQECARLLIQEGLRVSIEAVKLNKKLGERIHKTKKEWIPYYAIIGKKEVETQNFLLQSNDGLKQKYSLEEFLQIFRSRLERCRVSQELTFTKLPIVGLSHKFEKTPKIISSKEDLEIKKKSKKINFFSIRHSEKKANTEIFSLNIPGLYYQSILANGHCLYYAVALYTNDGDQQSLRKIVSEYLEKNLEEFRQFIELPEGRKVEDYLRDIREGVEWADNIEIEVLMRVLDRPILVVLSDGSIKNSEDLKRFGNSPIFVFYNNHNHYDALLLKDKYTTEEVLSQLRELAEVTLSLKV